MAASLKRASTIDFRQARHQLGKAPAAESPEARPENESDQALRYGLTLSLQTTLDLEKLLSCLREELSRRMVLEGIGYSNDDRALSLLDGDRASHSCGYRLITASDHLGEIVFYRDSHFSENEMELIELALSALLCPLKNALQYREAVQASLNDPLTGAGNRIAMDGALNRELALARRHQQPLSILILDIDHFKQVNDRHGHSAGDRVLKSLVERVRRINRSTDMLFRYGGEEFVLLLSKTDRKGALVIAERVRRAIESMEVCEAGSVLRISVSIGVASCCETDSCESLLKRADSVLYEVKRAGGNQVRMCPAGVSGEALPENV